MRRGFLVLCLWLTGLSAAMAERRVALVLGVEDYENLRPLENPVNDARAVEDLLEGLGFEVFLETDRDLKRTRRAIEDFREDAAGADVALLFYAGHGVAVAGENFLLPTDADAGSVQALRDTGLPLAEVQAALAAVAPVTLMLLDACRNDPFAGQGGDGRSAVALAEGAEVAAPGMGRMGRADGVLVAFAAAPNETAADGAGDNSPFTQALVRHFGTGGVEVRTALTLVQQDVYDRSRGQQLPYVESGVPELVFLTTAGDLPERDRLLIAMAGLTPDVRSEVEAMALARDMPLAPLFGAVIAADLGALPAGERVVRLAEAADGFVAFRTGLQALSSDDPQVAELRAQAEAALTLGAADEAREFLARAVAIDAAALETLEDRVQGRKLSQAKTHRLAADVSISDQHYDLAIAELTAAVALYAELEGPDLDRDAREAYGTALWYLGELQERIGKPAQAMQAYQEWNAVADARVSAAPDDAGWLRDTMVARAKLADIFAAQLDYPAALDRLTETMAIAERLAALAPDDDAAQWDLFRAHSRMGQFFAQTNAPRKAGEAYVAAIEIADRFTRLRPESRDWQIGLADTYDAAAQVFLAAGRLDIAMELNTDSGNQRFRLVEEHPDDLQLAIDLAEAHLTRGRIRVAGGVPLWALDNFREALVIFENVTELDPNLVKAKERVAAIHAFVGEAQIALGRGREALDAYGSVLETVQPLVAQDPDNVVWQMMLAEAHARLAGLSATPEPHLPIATGILDQMTAHRALPEEFAVSAANIRRAAARQGAR